MSQDLNHVAIIGRLARDPESPTPTVCKMRLANSDRIKRGEEWTDHTNWLDVTAFGKTAENCAKYLAKGRQIAVSGRLRYRGWEKDGNKRSAVEIIADHVQFIGGKGESGPSDDGAFKAAKAFVGAESGDDEDIPF